MTSKIPDGTYYVTKTLLGGEPDVNRRQIYRWPEDRPVATFNQAMKPWTPAMQDELEAKLSELRDA